MMRVFFVTLFLSIVSLIPAHGGTVEEATLHYFDIMKSEDYAASAALFDPAELKSFRDSLSFLVDTSAEARDQVYSALFGSGSTQESVDNLTDGEFFAAFFDFVMSQAGMAEIMSSANTEYLGHIMEGDTVAHAVIRMSLTTSDFSFRKLSVASFVRRGDSWKMKMTGDVRGVADQIRNAVGM